MKKPLRVTLDTNVIVSGLLFGGIPAQVLTLGLNNSFATVSSPALLEETERVIGSKKFGLQANEVRILLRPFHKIVEIVVPVIEIDAIKTCEADNRVLECAVTGNCNFIVTGDKRDLLHLKLFKKIQIVTARDFLEQFKRISIRG